MCQGCFKALSTFSTAGHCALRQILHRRTFNDNLRCTEETLCVFYELATQKLLQCRPRCTSNGKRRNQNTQKSMRGNETVKRSNNVKCVKGQNLEGVME